MSCVIEKCKRELDRLDKVWKQHVQTQAKLQTQLAKASDKEKVKTQKKIEESRQKLMKNNAAKKSKACVEKAKIACNNKK